jgi:hypothetical protein
MTTKQATATKTTATKTGRAATAAEKQASKQAEQVSLDMLVKAYRTAGADASVKSDLMLSIKEQRDSLRVLQARAAVRVFRHPEVGEKYATAAKVTGEARTTLRRYIDAGVSFGKSADSDGAPTARELKIIKDAFDTVAEKQAERDKAARDKAKDDAAKVSKLGQSEGEESEGEKSKAAAALESVEPTYKDVLKQLATLRTVTAQYKATGKLSAKEVTGLLATMQVFANELKAELPAKPAQAPAKK